MNTPGSGRPPDRYAVFGHPVAHSLSPRIHGAFAAQTGQALSYGATDVPPGTLAQAVRDFFAGGGRGANITLPHKARICALATRLDDAATLAGAANTLRLEADGTLAAFNTDGIGLRRDLELNLGVTLRGARILLVGAGGAAAGVLGPLLQAQPAQVVITNRSPARSVELAARFAALGSVRAAPAAALSGPFDLVLNASAAGHSGAVLPLPDALFGPGARAYDLSYGPAAQPFLAWAMHAGASRSSDGLGMLVEQAAEAFWLWRGVRPATEPVLASLRTAA